MRKKWVTKNLIFQEFWETIDVFELVYTGLAGNKKTPISWSFKKATNGFEPMIRELQSHALPLG